MTKTKKLRVLREVYASVPHTVCKGLCVDSCSTIPVYPLELEQLEAAAGRVLPTLGVTRTGAVMVGTALGAPCPLLVMGRCGVYEQRPLICRAFGSVEGLPCPHGCRPEDPMLTDVAQLRNFERVGVL